MRAAHLELAAYLKGLRRAAVAARDGKRFEVSRAHEQHPTSREEGRS